MRSREQRHRAQAGTTLVELIVSVAIIGLVLVLLVGAFSTGLIQSVLIKRSTAANAAREFELERIAASSYMTSPQPYSECFAAESASAPTVVAYQSTCPGGTTVRADVSEVDVQSGVQQWTVNIAAYPALSAVGTPVSVYKIRR